jgi:competence protein ComEC
VRGAVKIVTPPAAPGAWLALGAYVQGVRDAIDGRIRSVLAGDPGAIASALITGKRDAISPAVYDAMFVSGIGHVLSISGYHMAVVAGIVFFVVRAILALIPGLADRAPIKKWAALAALIVTAFYLVLSGAEVATQRSFIMIAIVLIGVMLDRPILTLRTVTIAALLVLLFAPEAIVHPSFQMSFAATLALVAGYERGLSWARAGADSSLGARAALWGVREVASVILASLLAGLATTPYAAYHFHRLAPYGVLANLLAMPIVSVWVMPMGILGVVGIPFGFDAEFWRQMGHGIDWMDAVALWVASLPGAFGRVTAFGTGPLLLGTAGLLVIGLLKTPLRWEWNSVHDCALAFPVINITPTKPRFPVRACAPMCTPVYWTYVGHGSDTARRLCTAEAQLGSVGHRWTHERRAATWHGGSRMRHSTARKRGANSRRGVSPITGRSSAVCISVIDGFAIAPAHGLRVITSAGSPTRSRRSAPRMT